MLTLADPWTNLIRLTLAGFAGAAGGADALVLDPHDAPRAPTFGARLARNTGLVLMEESHLGRVEDPAAGGLPSRPSPTRSPATPGPIHRIERRAASSRR